MPWAPSAPAERGNSSYQLEKRARTRSTHSGKSSDVVSRLRSAFRRFFADAGMKSFASRRPSRAVAVLLAALIGWSGAQWFYLGNRRRGVLYALGMLLFMLSYFLSVVDALRFIWVDRQEFDARFVAARLGVAHA